MSLYSERDTQMFSERDQTLGAGNHLDIRVGYGLDDAQVAGSGAGGNVASEAGNYTLTVSGDSVENYDGDVSSTVGGPYEITIKGATAINFLNNVPESGDTGDKIGEVAETYHLVVMGGINPKTVIQEPNATTLLFTTLELYVDVLNTRAAIGLGRFDIEIAPNQFRVATPLYMETKLMGVRLERTTFVYHNVNMGFGMVKFMFEKHAIGTKKVGCALKKALCCCKNVNMEEEDYDVTSSEGSFFKS